MSLVVGTINRVTNNFNTFEVQGTITASGNYATHGVTLDLSNVVPTNSVPTDVRVYEAPPTGTSSSGNSYVYAAGTTPANGAVQVFQGTTEVTNGTSFTSALVANLNFVAHFKKFI